MGIMWLTFLNIFAAMPLYAGAVIIGGIFIFIMVGVAYVVGSLTNVFFSEHAQFKSVAIIARGTAVFFGLCAADFLPVYVGALYFRRITKAGAIACFAGAGKKT